MRLYLIRHPRSVAPADVCYGGSDVAVAPEALDGCLRALLADPRLPRGLPVHSSPLARCAGLARALAQSWGAPPPALDARLAEMHFGDWELRRWSEIPRREVDEWAADVAGYRPGGGESVLQAARRVLSFHGDMAAQGRDACVVCHAGTIRLLRAAGRHAQPRALALAAAGDTRRIAYGELVVLHVNAAGRGAAPMPYSRIAEPGDSADSA